MDIVSSLENCLDTRNGVYIRMLCAFLGRIGVCDILAFSGSYSVVTILRGVWELDHSILRKRGFRAIFGQHLAASAKFNTETRRDVGRTLGKTSGKIGIVSGA